MDEINDRIVARNLKEEDKENEATLRPKKNTLDKIKSKKSLIFSYRLPREGRKLWTMFYYMVPRDWERQPWQI